MEQPAVGIKQVAFDGRLLEVNEHLCLILGYSRDELLQRGFELSETGKVMLGFARNATPDYQGFLACLHDADRASTAAAFTHALDRGAECDAAFRVLGGNDGVRWLRAKGRGVADEQVGKR